jgi:hypothetical protein
LVKWIVTCPAGAESVVVSYASWLCSAERSSVVAALVDVPGAVDVLGVVDVLGAVDVLGVVAVVDTVDVLSEPDEPDPHPAAPMAAMPATPSATRARGRCGMVRSLGESWSIRSRTRSRVPDPPRGLR